MSTVLIIGAKSDIALALAREFALHGYNLVLAARNVNTLQAFAADIQIRYGQNVLLKEFDIVNFSSHQPFYQSIIDKPDGVIVASGYMVEQTIGQNDWGKTLNTINVNYTGAVSILNIIANDFENKKNGFIIGISSVAGDRGRKANYIYGSAKSGFSTYLSGLRNRLAALNIQVLTVKPGFVTTKMTEGLDLPAKLTAKPEEVAKDIFRAHKEGKNIVYTKSVWKLIMLIIQHIPEAIFKKTSI